MFETDENGRTGLMRAAGSGDMAEVQAIIFSTNGTGLGSSHRLSLIDRTDLEDRTALDYASDAGHEAIFEFLRREKSRIEFFE